jgi:AraC family transcriptional activator FtrA
VDLCAAYDCTILALANTIVIPSWDPDRRPPVELAAALSAAWQRGIRIIAAGSGVFLCAWLDILKDRQVAAHWMHRSDILERCPEACIRDDLLYIDDGQLVTGAGGASSLDMFMHVVTSDHGFRHSNLIAQRLVAAPHRDGRQAQLLTRPVPRAGDSRIQKVLEHLRANATQAHRSEALAAMAGMSVTNFNRSFRRLAGCSAHGWLMRERIAIARELLEEDRLSIDQVGVEAGFGSTQAFRTAFARIVGLTPAAYRRRQMGKGDAARLQPGSSAAGKSLVAS